MKVAIVNCFETYEIREKWVRSFFIDKGDDVIVIKSDFLHIAKRKYIDNKKDYFYINVPPYKRNLSIKRLWSHYIFSKKVYKLLSNDQYDLVYALIPPNSITKSLSLYKHDYPNTKLIFDVIDLWPETMPINKIKNIFPFSLWGHIRNRHINNADYIITQCDLYQTVLNKYVDINKMKTIYLCKSTHLPTLNESINDSECDSINLCYLGSINNIIDITLIGKIIKIMSEKNKIVLKIIGTGENKSLLINEAKKNGAKVIDYGKVYDLEAKQKIFNSCHFGLNIYKTNTFIGMTMKSIDYLFGNLPIINNISGDTRKFVDTYSIGFNVDGPIDLKEKELFRYDYKKNISKCIEENLSNRKNYEVLKMIIKEIGG